MTQTHTTNRRLVLAQRPEGAPNENTLRLENTNVPSPLAGKMLLRTEFLSLDPYMRGRMSDAPSYAPPVALGEVMVGATVGQIGKILGCKVICIAGGAEKCKHAIKTLGFDACIDHKSTDFSKELVAATPEGIDIYFENVGGKVFDAVLPQLNPGARVPVCGLVSQYNATSLPAGPDRLGYLMGQILRKRITMRGFIIFEDFGFLYPEFSDQMGEWLKAGKIHYREQIIDGLEQAPVTFIGMLNGNNFGKCVIRVGPAQ